MSRNFGAALLGLIVLGSVAAEPSVLAAERPNVLFLMADDLNNRLGCYGDLQVQSPHIDKLAARGVRFDRAYCQFPLCGPSRNSLLTGLYPNQTGIVTNATLFRQTIPHQVSLPQAFRLDGYFAGRIGKMYHYNVPLSVGTNGHDDPASWELELNPAGCDRLEELPATFTLTPGQYGGTLSWYASPKGDRFHTDGLMADDAIWVLERCAQRKERPFFLAVGFFRPHTPYTSPKPYFDRYDRANMPVITDIAADQADLPAPALGSYKKEQDQLTDDLRRECIQAYYASVSFMDAQVGRVLSALERLGLAENTIVMFTSDHGYHLGEHGLWQKMSLFEESARVPLIFAGPGVQTPGSVVTAPVGLIDVAPTLLELARVPGRDKLPGQSLVPMLQNPATPGRGWALSQVTRGGGRNQGGPYMGYSLRTPRWRFTRWGDAGEHGLELYDHAADPRELTNLAKSPEHQATIETLAQQLTAAVATTFPPNGERPTIPQGSVMWNPNVTDP